MTSFFGDRVGLTMVLGDISVNVMDDVGTNWDIEDTSPFHGAHLTA